MTPEQRQAARTLVGKHGKEACEAALRGALVMIPQEEWYLAMALDALDERDALLAKCAEFLGAAYMDDRRHEQEWALGEEIDALLERR